MPTLLKDTPLCYSKLFFDSVLVWFIALILVNFALEAMLGLMCERARFPILLFLDV